MSAVRALLELLVLLFLLSLVGRMIFDWVQVFSRSFRPRGPVLVLAEGVYTVTDPPLRALRKVLPPVRLGAVSLDLGFMVLVFACWVVMGLL
ncbi:YggT family protein [Kineococcus glutinatus]|uniref:YggT family protein n=1 Tax=Kineococcus glutinatus TaxID=1070872 RepID=A0ABP9I888_9ACTN